MLDVQNVCPYGLCRDGSRTLAVCSVESCVNKTIIWLYVSVSESLFNVSIVSRLIYTNCVIDSICTPFALFSHRFNQDFRESIHVEVVRVLCAIFKIQWF